MSKSTDLVQWTCTRYGGPEVLVLKTLPLPAPRGREVLIRIRARTVSTADARIRGLRLPHGMGVPGRLVLGLRGPRQPVLGGDLAGEIVAVGADVRRFAIGDRVVGFPDTRMRCHASHRIMAEDGMILPTPGHLTDAEAASLCFGGLSALSFLRKAGLAAGQRLMVIGASGAVGAAMVQLAKGMGAHVTAVAGPLNQGLLRSLGADACIDYSATEYLVGPQQHDVIADCVGATSLRGCRHILADGGCYLAIAGGLSDMIWRRDGPRRAIAGMATSTQSDLAHLLRLAATGALRAVIDQTFAFESLPAAHARVDSGHKRGSVVVLD